MFFDTDTEQRLQNVSYSVHMSLDGKSLAHTHAGSAPDGIGEVEQKFDSMGSLSIIVESIKVRNTPIEGAAQFTVSVVPEFPLAPLIITAVVVGGAMAGQRIHGIRDKGQKR